MEGKQKAIEDITARLKALGSQPYEIDLVVSAVSHGYTCGWLDRGKEIIADNMSDYWKHLGSEA